MTEWSYDPDDREIRDEIDGSVLFDLHNATDEQATIAAAAPELLAVLQALMSDPEVTTVCAPEVWELADAALTKATGEGE